MFIPLMPQKSYKDFFKRSPVGKYSGSERLDPSKLEEPDSDSDYTRNMYLEDLPNDPDFQDEIRKTMEEKLKAIKMTAGIDPTIRTSDCFIRFRGCASSW